jgi:hypothetical protein
MLGHAYYREHNTPAEADQDFERYLVSLESQDCSGDGPRVEFDWQVAELSAKIVSSSLVTGLAATASSMHRGSWAVHETRDMCYTLYHLVNTVSQAQRVLDDRSLPGYPSQSTKHRIQLSFPAGQGATGRPEKKGRRAAVGSREASEECTDGNRDEGERQKRLDEQRSRQLWTTWSTSAADAFIGDFVLPPGLSVTQALM